MKKLLFSLLALVASMGVFQASAITVDDLDGKLCGQIFRGCYEQKNLAVFSTVGRFEKTGTNTVMVHGFWNNYDVEFTLNRDNTLTLTIATGNNNRKKFYGTDDRSMTMNIYRCLESDFTSNSSFYGRYTSSSYNTFTSDAYGIGDSTSGLQRFNFNGYIECYENGGNSIYRTFALYPIDGTHTTLEKNGDTYDCNYTISGNNIVFYNFYNLGMVYKNTISPASMNYTPITATVKSNGEFTIPSQVVYSYMTMTGRREWFEGMKVGYSYYDGTVCYSGYREDKVYIGSKSNGQSGDITGRIISGLKHHSFDEKNYWAYDENIKGSELHTINNELLEVDKFYYYDSYIRETYECEKMVIYEKTNEITHSVSVQLLDKDYRAGDQLYIRGQIYAGENDKYVDHYELYMVPGNVSSVTSNTHKTTGLVGAMNISDSKFWSSFTKSAAKVASAEEDETDNKAAELNADGKFNLVIPEADMKTAGLTPSVNGGYTIFVKTHYTTASGLEPTFHALTYVDNRNATGVDMIEVEDSNAPAIYFNMNGQQVNGKNMAPGIYIKKQGNKTTKVVVK